MNLFLIALWAFCKAHPNASFNEFQRAAERARKLTGWSENDPPKARAARFEHGEAP